jgi:NTE family protein
VIGSNGSAVPGEQGDEVIEFLASVPLFGELPRHLLEQIRAICQSERLLAGEWLFRQDDKGDALYVVRTGRMEVIREEPGPAEVLVVSGPGAALGELSILSGRPRAASVRAIRDCELLRLDRDVLLEMLGVSPDLAAGLLRILGQHLRAVGNAAGQRGKRPAVISLVPDGPELPLGDIGHGLRAAFADHGTATLLDGSEVERGALDHNELASEWARRLNEFEQTHDHVVLVANHGADDAWQDFCRRHADRIIVVTRADGPPSNRSFPSGSDLLFWASRTSAGTMDGWLNQLNPASHYLVDPSRPQIGFSRAARRLSGTALGVVLSGGGARCLASIGALDELTRAGVVIDRVGGSSLGALVAGMFALGMPPGEIERRCQSEFAAHNAYGDYILPRVALLRGRRFSSMLTRIFADTSIEQLSRPYFCLSADLGSASPVVHRRGSLAAAVAASTAIPGVLPPQLADGRVLFDGSVLDNLPVSVMVDDDEGPVVAIGVGLKRWAGRGRGDRPLPGIMDTISRSALLGGSQHQAESHQQALMVIEPDPPDSGQLEFTHLAAILETGRAAVRSAMGEYPGLLPVAGTSN